MVFLVRIQGTLLYEQRRYSEAISSFERAVALDPLLLSAVDAVENIKSLAVDRWHFRMLNDRARNEAYAAAIGVAVAEAAALLGRPPVVLDIGTGTGLLSLMAAAAGAAHVYACEANVVLSEVATAVVAQHGMAGRVTVIAKPSWDLRVGDQPGELGGP
jgi:predicted O-methyltransferase YrrM